MSETIQVGGTYWDAQLQVFDALESGDYDLVVFRTGYGGGKTLLGSDWIHSVALQVAKSDNLVLAPDATKGGPTTYKRFFDRLPGENTIPDEGGEPENSPIVEDYNRNERRLTYKNGSVARLGSADVWNRYAGGEFNAIYCDEVAHYGTTDLYDLHEMLISRQRTEEGPNVTLWTSTGNGYNQFYDITEREIQPSDEGEEPLPWADRMKVIVGNSLDNPFLNEKEKLEAQFKGTEKAEQALYGGFAAPQGLVYADFNRNTHIKPHEEIELGEGALAGYDYGFRDPRVYLDIRKTPQDQYVVWDMYYEEQKAVEHLVDPDNKSGWLIENDKPRCRVFCDHDPEHIQKFKRAGYDARKAEKDIDEGIDEVRTVLETDHEGRPGLLVTERCTPLIQEFLSYKESDVGTKGAMDHALDALRYAIMGDRYTNNKTVRRKRGNRASKGSVL